MIKSNSSWNRDTIYEGIKLLQENNKKRVNIIEFGVFKNETVELMSKLLTKKNIDYNIYGIDSFEGLPEEKENTKLFWLFKKGEFKNTNQPRDTDHTKYIKCWFNELTINQLIEKGFNKETKFDLVHIDSDLYVSCIDAWKFLLEYDLVGPGSIIIYDEFRSTPSLLEGGESKAHIEICDKYKIEFQEVFRNEYRYDVDGSLHWQNVFVIKSINNGISDIGLIKYTE